MRSSTSINVLKEPLDGVIMVSNLNYKGKTNATRNSEVEENRGVRISSPPRDMQGKRLQNEDLPIRILGLPFAQR